MRFSHQIINALVGIGLHITAILSLAQARELGRWLGRFYYRFDSAGRRVAERNIALAYPELDLSEQDELVRACLEETGALACEMGHVWVKPWEYSRQLMTDVEGADLVQAALGEGQGVIILGPHLGNWEVLGLHLATLGDMVALYEPPKISALGDRIKTARERSGGRLVPTTARGLAALVKSVKGGGISGILPDQVPEQASGGRNVPFMGVPCATAALGCNLINRSGAIAFMGAALRVPGGFKVRYVPAPSALYGDDEEAALTAMNDAVEELIRGWDAQYQWLYKRFRQRPVDQPKRYNQLKVPRAQFTRTPESTV